jgi:hypothetical protein
VNGTHYLGQILSAKDSDWSTVYWNLGKAWQKRAMLSCLLVEEGGTPHVSGMFYRGVVQAVLLHS